MDTTTTPDCLNCKARPKTVFAGCNNAALIQQCKVKVHIRFDVDDIIFSEREPSDGVYCLYEGAVALHKKPDDGKGIVVMHESYEGAILGVEGVVNNTPRQTTAQTLTPVAACFIPKNVFLDVVSKDPRVATNVMQRICETIRYMGLKRGAEKLFCE